MTILDRNKIDFMAMSKERDRLILTISDHLSWTDYDRHSMALQDKITDYLECVHSMRQRLKPAVESLENDSTVGMIHSIPEIIEIQLMMKHTPTTDGQKLLNRVKNELENLGVLFSFQVFTPPG